MDRWHYHHAARTLHSGGIIAYPTEAVFGLGCDPHCTDAIKRLLAIKHRSSHKGLIVLGDSIARVRPFIAARFFREYESIIRYHWPGPITLICEASAQVASLLTGGRGSIALRVTTHPVAAALVARYKTAIVSTSANRSQKEPARSTWDVRKQFFNQVDYIVPGQVGGLSKPTPILDIASGHWIRR